jgi:hypothetical protein
MDQNTISIIEDWPKFFVDEDDDADKELKKQASKKDESKKSGIVLEKTNASIKAVNRKIRTAAAYLITAQSNKIIGGTSPLDEENELNVQKGKNDFAGIIESSKTLDDEYYRFMAEMELSKK